MSAVFAFSNEALRMPSLAYAEHGKIKAWFFAFLQFHWRHIHVPRKLSAVAQRFSKSCQYLIGAAAIASSGTLFAAEANDSGVNVDGVIEAAEWADAERFDSMISLQPLSGEAIPRDLHTTAYLKATPDGVAVAFRALQPNTLARVNQRVRRDFQDQVDRVNFMIDFNGDGAAGFAFTLSAGNDIADEVITNENRFNPDWAHATSSDDQGYSYEMLIPYSITQIKPAINGKRTFGVYFDRVVAETGTRYGFPKASFTQPRFLSDFHRVEVAAFEQSLLAVTPYAVSLRDLKSDRADHKVGLDVLWKPSSRHQFALTLNPDFGQVESDELVVNFENIENFFTDKRPFFTENQAAFAGSYPGGDLFYTRRIGGPADDGSGAADINAAIKANGSIQALDYALFAATEDGDAGRDFLLARAAHKRDGLLLDFTQSFVDRPFLDREAAVSAIHSNYQPNTQWRFDFAAHRTEINQAGDKTIGYGGGLIADWDMPGPWRQQYFAIAVDADANLNDLGFQGRNDFRYFEWETGYRQDELSADSAFASHAYEFEVANERIGSGDSSLRNLTAQRYSEFRDGGNMFAFVRRRLPSVDDRVARGNGLTQLRGGYQFGLERSFARRDNGWFSWFALLGAASGRSTGRINYNYGLNPRFYLSEQLDFNIGLFGTHYNDFLLWRRNRDFGRFQGNRLDLSSDLNWFIGDKQELRIKLQAIAIDAELEQSLTLDQSGQLRASNAVIDDFRLRNLGFQIRYRYKLGNLSDLYLVYSRGGDRTDMLDGNASDALVDAFDLRDADQLLLKVAYRFEL
jgi:hypothetical protein